MSLSRRAFFEKAAVAGALGGAWAGAQPGPQSGRPNILYVIQEDIGPNHACYGEPLVKTPNVDRLAAQGMRFTNTFCTGPVCSASRSALMSGRYQNNIGAHNHRTWEWHKRPLPAPAGHISEWFRNAGYFTCNLQPERGKRRPLNGAGGSGKVDLNFVLTGANKDNFFDGSDWKERKAGQPFFAHITIMEAHKGGGWTLARQQPKSHLVDPEKLKLGAYYPDSPVARDEYANYLDALHLSDGYVGQLLQRLEDEGLARNTVVVLSSDHGPLFRGKQFLYDGGMRIPLIVRLPDGRPPGAMDNRLVSGIDRRDDTSPWAPAIADILGTRARDMCAAVRQLRELDAAGELSCAPESLAVSFLHMHINRMVRHDPNTHEIAVYEFLRRIYRRDAARHADANI